MLYYGYIHTGLDGVLSNRIMEMACIITDGNLDIVAEVNCRLPPLL